MATAETARLIASLELQDKNFTRGLARVEKGVGRVDRKLGAFSGFVNRNMARAIDSIGVRLVSSVGQGLEEMATLEDATTSVTGAIQQVGKGWTLTADDIAAAANRIESETDAAFDDKAIVAASETLIRYGKVSEKNLVPALEVMTDLAAKTGGVDRAATLLGKALADPAQAAGKLRKQGILLTDAQNDQIKAMVKVGDTAGAQTLLLEILSKTTKGAAKASSGPYRDALNKLADAGEDLRRGFVTGLAPAILEVSELLTDELAKPSTMQTLKSVGVELGSALKGLIGVVKALPWGTIGASLKLAGTGAKAVLDAFLGLPPWVQTAVLTGWGLNKLSGGLLGDVFSSLASGLIKGVLGMNAGVVNINAAVVNGGGIPGVPGAKPGGGGVLGTVSKVARVGAGALAGGAVLEVGKIVTDQIDPGFDAQLGRGDKPLGNRDPRRFDKNGQVIANWTSEIARNTRAITPAALNTASVSGGTIVAAALEPRLQAVEDAARNQASIATREASATDSKLGATVTQLQDVSAKTQATKAAIANAASIASRENSAQKAETARVAGLVQTQTQQQTALSAAQVAVAAFQGVMQAGRDALQLTTTSQAGTNAANASRSAGATVSSSMSSAASRIVGAIWAARPVIQSTNVVNNYTRTERGGASSDSRTRRAD